MLEPGAGRGWRRWLLRSFIRALDQRLLGCANTVDPATHRGSLGLKIDVLGLDSESLRTLEEIGKRLSDRRIVILVPHLAAFADLGSYLATGARLKTMGFNLCLEGLCHHTLPLINRTRLGVDFLRMEWNPTLEQAAPSLEPLKRGIERAEPGRVILSGCDSAAALKFGLSLGLTLFQGRHVEHQVDSARSPTMTLRAARL